MENLRAIGLMVAAMATFAASDLFIIYASRTLSIAEIMFFMGVFGSLVFAGLTKAAGLPVFSRLFFHPMVILRNGAEILGSICMITALTLAPLSLVSSITQAMPLVVTAGAALFLGEKVGPRRWIAVMIGLAGVLLILRPGAGGDGGTNLSLGALIAVGATLGLGGRDVITRLAPKEISTLQLATYAFFMLVPIGAVLLALGPARPSRTLLELGWLVCAAGTAAMGYYAITAAMRIGEISAVSPFRYSRLIFALMLALVFLGERPDAITLIGAVIIIASGLFVLLRTRQIYRPQASVSPSPKSG